MVNCLGFRFGLGFQGLDECLKIGNQMLEDQMLHSLQRNEHSVAAATGQNHSACDQLVDGLNHVFSCRVLIGCILAKFVSIICGLRCLHNYFSKSYPFKPS